MFFHSPYAEYSEHLFYPSQNLFVFGQIGHLCISLSQYYTQEWLVYEWIRTFPLTSGLQRL